MKLSKKFNKISAIVLAIIVLCGTASMACATGTVPEKVKELGKMKGSHSDAVTKLCADGISYYVETDRVIEYEGGIVNEKTTVGCDGTTIVSPLDTVFYGGMTVWDSLGIKFNHGGVLFEDGVSSQHWGGPYWNHWKFFSDDKFFSDNKKSKKKYKSEYKPYKNKRQKREPQKSRKSRKQDIDVFQWDGEYPEGSEKALEEAEKAIREAAKQFEENERLMRENEKQLEENERVLEENEEILRENERMLRGAEEF